MSKKIFHQKLECYRFKLPPKKVGLVGSVQDEIKCHNLKNNNFQKKSAKNKSITILLLMSTLRNFVYNVKTG